MLDIEKLYRNNRSAVRAVILPYARQYDTVDELMQDTFVAALEAKDTYRGDASPVTWLCGIAKNVARNHVRSVMRSIDLVSEAEFVGGDIESYADTLNASDFNDDPAELVEAEDFLAKSYLKMPERMGECVKLRTDGYTNADIADAPFTSAGRVVA